MFRIGDQIGAYRLIRLLGQGGMGTVYEVEHEKLGTRHALKVFTLENGHADHFRKRFLAEGKILARLAHPGLVHVFDMGVDAPSGKVYFAMDLIGGRHGAAPRSLADVTPGSVDEEQVLVWFTELCEALSYVHAQGVVHRDIKLNNILLTDDGHAVLSDFGISKVVDSGLRADMDLTRTLVTGQVPANLAMGTVGYMAPEVVEGRGVSPASDVYSLAVAVFRLLTNVWYDPALAPRSSRGGAHQISSISLLEMFEYDWKAVLPEMLDADPLRRPRDLGTLPRRVRSCAGRQDESDVPPGKRRSVLWIAAGLVLVLLAAAGLFVAGRNRTPVGEAPPSSAAAAPAPGPHQAPPGTDFEIEFFGHRVRRTAENEDKE